MDNGENNTKNTTNDEAMDTHTSNITKEEECTLRETLLSTHRFWQAFITAGLPQLYRHPFPPLYHPSPPHFWPKLESLIFIPDLFGLLDRPLSPPPPPPRPFSRSLGRRGVGGTSSIRTPRPPRVPFLTDLGNSERRGVRAVTTRRADFRMFSRTFHSRFLAR